MKILGHELPTLLCHFVEDGGFNKPILIDPRVFIGRENPAKVNLYHYDGMWGKTSRFLTEHDRAMLGHPDTRYPPGNLNPQQCVLIGAIGLDHPLALDYRINSMNPCVVALQWGEIPVTDNRWLKIADSFDEYATKLGLVNRN